MSLVLLTRPDGSPVAINPDEIVHLSPVPTTGPLMGPLTIGTRIVFRNQSHQDVKELIDVVVKGIDNARGAVGVELANRPGPAVGAPRAMVRNRANPTYADILAMLDTLVVTTDQNIDDAPHAAFWRTMNRNEFVVRDVSDWTGGQVTGQLVTPGNPDTSPFYLALAGKAPFDGSKIQQMPDIAQDPNANLATPDDLALVVAWIKNGAPA